MQRKPAFMAATAVTLVCGSGLVAAAAITGSPMLGFGQRRQPVAAASVAARAPSNERVVQRTKNVYDTVVVPTSAAQTATTVSRSPQTDAVNVRTVVTTAGTSTETSPTTGPAPTTTTTLPRVTTTTQPPHHHESGDGGSDDPPGDD